MADRKISTTIVLNGEKEYRAAVRDINSEMTKLKSEMALTESQFQGNANSLEFLTKKHENLTKRIEQQGKRVKELEALQTEAGAEYEKTKNLLEAATKAHGEASEEAQAYAKRLENAKLTQDKYNTQVNRAQAELNKLNSRLEDTDKYMDEARQSADGCATSIDEYGKKVKQAAKNAEDAGDKSSLMGTLIEGAVGKAATAISVSGLIALLGQIASGLDDCAKSAASFDTGMAKIRTLAGSELAAGMKEEILAVSSQLGVAATEVADAVYNAISAGVDPTHAVDFTASALQLAKGGFTEAATAVDVLTTALNAYGLSVEDVSMVSDRLITTQNKGKTTVNELSGQIGKAIPVAAAYNVNLDNLSASLAIMTANGTGTAESVTYVKSMISELGDSGSKVAGILKEETGKSFADLMGSGSSLGEVLDVLYGSVNNNTTAFGDLWGSSTALMAALSLLSSGTEGYNDMLREINDSAGATDEAFEVMADTYEATSARLATSWENFKITVGENWAPVKQAVQEVMISLLDGLSGASADADAVVKDLAEAIKELELSGRSSSTSLGMLSHYYHQLLEEMNVDFDWSGFDDLTAAVDAARAAAVEARPELFGLTESEEALQSATEQANEEFERQRQFEEDVAEAQGPLVESMTALIDSYNAAYDSAYSSISGQLGLFNDLSAETSLSIDDMIGTLEHQVGYMDTYARNIERAMELGVDHGLIAKLSDGSAESAGILQEIVNSGEDKISELNEKFAEVEKGKKDFSDTVGQMEEEFALRMQGIVETYAESVDDMDMYDEALESGKNTVQGLIAGAETLEYDVAAVFDRIAAGGIEAYNNRLNIQSPSRVMHKSGVYTMQGLINGIKSMEGELKAALGEVADESVVSTIDTLKSRTADLVKAYESAYKSAYRAIDGRLGLFNEISAAESKPLEDMLSALDAQLEYISAYNENLQKAMSMGLDAGLISELSDGSAESAGMLQEIVNSGEEAIAELNEKFAAVREGKEDFADTVAAMETGFDEEMKALVADWESAVADMDMYDEAFRAAQGTMEGMLDGVDSLEESVISKFSTLARDAIDAYNAELASALSDIQAAEAAGSGGLNITDMRELMAAVVDGIQTAVTGIGGGTQSFNLVFPDGTKLASYLLEPMASVAQANGTPIINPR